MSCNCKKKAETIALKYGDGDVLKPKRHDLNRNTFSIVLESFFQVIMNIIIGVLAAILILVFIIPIILWIIFSICIGKKDNLTVMPDFAWNKFTRIINRQKKKNNVIK